MMDYDESSYPRVADDMEGSKAGTLESELQCPVCAQVLLDPMTLICGHSFCQLCLARIWSSGQHTSKLLCPSCRNPWTQMPGVNIQLRNIVESMYSEDVQQRRAAHTDEDRQLLLRFSNYRHSVRQPKRVVDNAQLNKVMMVIVSVAAVCVVIVGSLVMWVSVGADGKFMRKPVTSWDSDDVLAWVEGLGDWTIPNITAIFKLQALTGPQLLLVDNDTLTEFGIEPAFRRQTIMQAVSQLREDLYSEPLDLYQFKAAHRRTSLLLTLFYTNWPRLTLLYCYVFEYYSVFVPLGRAQFSSAEMEPSWLQSVVLCLLILLSPHVPVCAFTALWFTTHPWVSLAVYVHCGCAMVQQSQALLKAHTMRIRHVKILTEYGLRELLKFAVYLSLYVIVWPLVPHFICDALFYLTLWSSCISYIVVPPINYLFKR